MELSTELLDVLRDRGGIFTGGVIAEERNQTEYEFQHKSIQDYLTAYTLATDHGLWQSDGFDLFEVIYRKEFLGRTLEFFVNVKKGNPDVFFRTYLQHLKPETIYAKQLNHFVQYYLIAQEKDADLEDELVQKCIEILMNSPDLKEVQLAQVCLVKLTLIVTADHLAFIQKVHHNWVDNFRAVKLAQLYYAKGKGLELLPASRETTQLKVMDVDKGLFYRFRNYCLLGLLQKDHQIWKHLLIQEMPIADFNQLSRGLALLALKDWLDLRNLRNLRDWWDLLNLEQKL